MARISSIREEDLRVGDVISVVGQQSGMLFSQMTVNRVEPTGIYARHEDDRADGFSRDGYWKFYLVDRPKPKVPTKLGSVIKEGDTLWVLCDPRDTLKWRSTRDDWQSDEYFDQVDWELVD